MDLLSIIIVLIVVGIVLMLINQFIPMDGSIKRILNYAAVIFVLIWLLQATGLIDSLRTIKLH